MSLIDILTEFNELRRKEIERDAKKVICDLLFMIMAFRAQITKANCMTDEEIDKLIYEESNRLMNKFENMGFKEIEVEFSKVLGEEMESKDNGN